MSMSYIMMSKSLFSVAHPRRRCFQAFVMAILVLLLSGCSQPEEILTFNRVHVIGCKAQDKWRAVSFLDALNQVQTIWTIQEACDVWNAAPYWVFTVRGNRLIQAGVAP